MNYHHQSICQDCQLIWNPKEGNDPNPVCPACGSTNVDQKTTSAPDYQAEPQKVVIVKEQKPESWEDYLGCGGCLGTIVFFIVLFTPPLWIPAILVLFIIKLLKS